MHVTADRPQQLRQCCFTEKSEFSKCLAPQETAFPQSLNQTALPAECLAPLAAQAPPGGEEEVRLRAGRPLCTSPEGGFHSGSLDLASAHSRSQTGLGP